MKLYITAPSFKCATISELHLLKVEEAVAEDEQLTKGLVNLHFLMHEIMAFLNPNFWA